MSCPNKPGEGLCLTCRLGGLIRCPTLGTPLPLAEAEKPKIIYRGHLWSPGPNDPLRGSNDEDSLRWW